MAEFEDFINQEQWSWCFFITKFQEEQIHYLLF
jgi:hypothetical protein